MLTDSIVRAIRTYVPIIVGVVATAIARAIGVEIDTTASVAIVQPVVIGAYYAAARWAEARWPVAGWLLGHPQATTPNTA